MTEPNFIIDQILAEESKRESTKQELIQGENLGSWWTWTQAEFTAWCDANLMTDGQIDATTLSAALKTNLKANNAFTRNAGKLLIIIRNVIKWLTRNV